MRKLDFSNFIGTRLIFAQRYDFQKDFDFAFVEVKAGANPWTTIAVFSGQQLEFRDAVMDLSRFDGQKNVKIRFRISADKTVTADGWYIDDVRVVGGTVD